MFTFTSTFQNSAIIYHFIKFDSVLRQFNGCPCIDSRANPLPGVPPLNSGGSSPAGPGGAGPGGAGPGGARPPMAQLRSAITFPRANRAIFLPSKWE